MAKAASSKRTKNKKGPGANQPSLRTWIETLTRQKKLKRVKAEVDWDEEIGAITRINMGLEGPALLFENIKDYKNTRSTKFMTCGLSNTQQVALLLGLPKNTPDKDMVRHLKDTYQKPVKPKTIGTGPVKDHILKGDDINLLEFPALKYHASDGGRYIDTFCGVVTNDPATGRPNVGLYRGQILGPDKIGKLIVPTQGYGGHLAKRHEAGDKMPVAIVHGWHDAMPFCAGSPFPKQICEWDMIGAIHQQPVEMVKCETVDIKVPATAEIVVEGFIDPDPETFELEGPFADYPGYEAKRATPKPVLKVTCITHRDKPILRGALEGSRPGLPSEDGPLCAFSWSAIAWNLLEDAGVSGVTDVWMPPVSTGINIVVQIHKQYRNQAMQIGNVLWGSSSGQWFFKNVMVVEEDIDIRDPIALDWAFAFRVDPGAGDIALVGPTFGSLLDPSTPAADRDVLKYGTGRWTRSLIDATRSWAFEPNPDFEGRRYPPLNKIDAKLERKIKRRWQEYGIGIDYMTDDQRENLTMEKLSKIFSEV